MARKLFLNGALEEEVKQLLGHRKQLVITINYISVL